MLLLDLAARGPNRLRLHALRLIRKVLPREDALATSRLFLDSEDASTRRMAIRAVCHGRDEASLLLDGLMAGLIMQDLWKNAGHR